MPCPRVVLSNSLRNCVARPSLRKRDSVIPRRRDSPGLNVMLSEVEASVLELPPQRCCSSLFTKRDSLSRRRDSPGLNVMLSEVEASVLELPPQLRCSSLFTKRDSCSCPRYSGEHTGSPLQVRGFIGRTHAEKTAPLSTKRGERSGGSSRLPTAVGVFIGRTRRFAPTVRCCCFALL